jgi:sugar phosphate isomerase/epimerase
MGYDLDRVLLGLSTAGFRYVELFVIPSPKSRIIPEQMSQDDVKRLRSQLAGYSLTPVSISAHSDLARPEGVSHFKARIDFAAALEVEIVNTGTGHTESSADEEQFVALMKDEVIPYAKARNVKIALETHGGMTGTAQDCLRTLGRLDSAQVGINYDPANVIYYRGVRPEQDIAQIAAHIIHVHMKDQRGGQGVADFPPLGEGEIDFARLLEILARAGYRGPISAELELKGTLTAEAEDEVRRRSHQFMEQLIAEHSE